MAKYKKNVRMAKLLVFCFTMFFTGLAAAQSVAELDRRNGFKDIKMTSRITDYEGLEFKREIDSEIFPKVYQYVRKKGFYDTIGGIKVFDLEVNTYDSAIYEIRIVTEKNPNLYKALKKNFGQPEYDYRGDKYYWKTDNLRLSYDSHSKTKIEMVYFSYLMTAKLKEDKQQVVEDIADDF
ncbi:MAG: hypothetical protein AAGA02_06420 [Bacteroidota bacterium]